MLNTPVVRHRGKALTATTKTGMADFTFPSSTEANLIFKLDGSQNGDSATTFSVVSNTEVQGSATSGNFCGAGNTYTLYFDMQFSQPFSTSGTFSGSTLRAGVRQFALKQSAPAKPHTVPAGAARSPITPSTTERCPRTRLTRPRSPALPAPT